MKKTVWMFGLISGLVLSISMLATMPFVDQLHRHDIGEVIGYTTMVLAFLLVYFGVRSYRDNVLGGIISFGRAFGTGMLIVFVATACYVATWELIYFKLRPDFPQKFAETAIEKARAKSVTPEAAVRAEKEARAMLEMYNKPLMNVAITFTEPMPPGVLLALISAGVLRKKRKDGEGESDALLSRPATAV